MNNKIKNTLLASVALLSLSALTAPSAVAQSAIDAYNISQNGLKGTARFMSMGGAFTALGGDLSTLGQNPAGIGVYRYSEIGATLDIDIRNYKSVSPTHSFKENQTRAFCNNFGYVGSVRFDSPLKTFNWGVTYGRVKSFDHITKGYNGSTSTSLSNYIAGFTNGVNPADMEFDNLKNYNPYFDSNADWLSILAYSSYMINPTSGTNYVGLYKDGTIGDAEYHVRNRGYIDEYNFSFGGNVENMVYWGIGIGVTDLDYRRDTYYSESMENARVANQNGQLVNGDAGFNLYNRKRISGSGWNLKLGLIFRPVNELRIGLAFHTPTWYKLTQGYDAEVDYSYYDPNLAESDKNPMKGDEFTEWANFDWRLRTPWRIMTGIAGVISDQAIVSLDYEYQAYDKMHVRDQNGPYLDDFEADEPVNQDIRNYFQGTHQIRLGVEYRVTPQFSLRAGYNYSTSSVNDDTYDGRKQVFTSGTDPSFDLTKSTQNISFGLGYRSGGFYIDGAYVYRKKDTKFFAYTNYDGLTAPSCKVTDNLSSIVISAGYKF